jgi:hypothetical protein
MTKFLVLYRYAVSDDDQPATTDPDARAASIRAWWDWAARNDDAITDFGSPTQAIAGTDPGAATFVGGYSLLQAADAGTLQRILADHPHLAGGGTIEVLEVLDLPGM